MALSTTRFSKCFHTNEAYNNGASNEPFHQGMALTLLLVTMMIALTPTRHLSMLRAITTTHLLGKPG